MRYGAVFLLIALGGAVAAVIPTDSVPKPSIVPTSWELQFSHSAPQAVRLAVPGRKQPQIYWYMLYKVTNRTESDQIFVPDFVLYSDTGEILRAGKGVPSAVFAAIQKRHNNPLLLNLADITGRVLQGRDNAKEGVAIWLDFDAQAAGFDVFVGGLSGERARVKLPAPVLVEEMDEQGKIHSVAKDEVMLAKTLRLAYRLAGKVADRAAAKPKLDRKEWVMR